MKLITSLVGILLVAVAPGACSFGGAPEGHDDAFLRCVDTSTSELGLDEPTPLHMSAAQVLEFAGGVHDTAATWRVRSSASEPAHMELRVSPRSTRARFVTRTLRSTPALPDQACRPRLEIDVRVDLALSAAGQAVEAGFDAVLISDAKSLAQLSVRALPDAFSSLASLELGSVEHVAQVLLTATFTPHSTSGELTVELEHLEQPPGGAMPAHDGKPGTQPFPVSRKLVLATWPTEAACEAGELPVELRVPLFDVDFVQNLAAIAPVASVVWQDGTTSAAKFEVISHGTIGCIHAGSAVSDALVLSELSLLEQRMVLRSPVTLSIATEDGRWVGMLEASLRFHVFKDGGLQALHLSHTASSTEPAQLVRELGLHQLDVAGLEQVSAALDVAYDAAGDRRFARGTLSVRTPAPSPCGPTTRLCTAPPQSSVIEAASIEPPH